MYEFRSFSKRRGFSGVRKVTGLFVACLATSENERVQTGFVDADRRLLSSGDITNNDVTLIVCIQAGCSLRYVLQPKGSAYIGSDEPRLTVEHTKNREQDAAQTVSADDFRTRSIGVQAMAVRGGWATLILWILIFSFSKGREARIAR